MISNKLFHIDECWFNLPDDFTGTCGDALMLLAKYRLEKEKGNQIGKNFAHDEDGSEDLYSTLMSNNTQKATLSYCIQELDKKDNTYKTAK